MKRFWMRSVGMAALFVVQISVAPVYASTGAGPIEVVVRNVRSSQGVMQVQLCTEKEFLKRCSIISQVQAVKGLTSITFKNVQPGRYAVIVVHDANGNGKADRSMIGLPTEDVGFSNDALKGLSKPTFAVAAFDHGTQVQRITVALKRF